MCEKPKDVKFKNTAIGSIFFENADKILTYHINGRIRYYSFENNKKPTRLISFKQYECPVRSVVLNSEQNILFCGSSLGNVDKIDIETTKTIHKYKNNCSDLASLLVVSEKLLILTSNDGLIEIFDINSSKKIHQIEDLGIYSNVTVNSDWKTLIYSSLDGVLKAFSIKNWKLIDSSDQQDDEYTCSSFIDKGKVIFGSSKDNGRFCIYNKDEWGNPSDILYTGTKSIDHIAMIDESRLVFTSSDGFVGQYRLFPSYVAGYYQRDFPHILTCISVSNRSQIIMASSEYGLNFWSIKDNLLKSDLKKSSKRLKNEKLGQRIQNVNFFKDLE